jgi:two-component system response regulator DesR
VVEPDRRERVPGGVDHRDLPAAAAPQRARRRRGGRRRRYVDPDIAASALAEDDCPLTDREPEVLRAARTGASVNDIASQVHLAPGTVRNYLSAAMAKLGVSSGTPPRTAPGRKAGSR